MEVGATDSAGEDTEEGMAFGDGGNGGVFDLKRAIGGVKDSCFHEVLLESIMPMMGRNRRLYVWMSWSAG
jgi:hypothetical protein